MALSHSHHVDGLPPWPQVIDVLAELNDELREVAAEHGTRVADIHGYFLGHGLRAGNRLKLIPGRRIRTCGFATSFGCRVR